MRYKFLSSFMFLCVMASSMAFSACDKQPPARQGDDASSSAQAEEPDLSATRSEQEAPLLPGDGGEEEGPAGLVVHASSKSGQETFAAIKAAIEANEALTLMTVVDHAENARKAELELEPTWVLIFGNPKVGTPLMKSMPTVAIDLPQRILVYERDGKTFVAYNDPFWMAERHGLKGEQERLSKVSGLLDKLAKSAP